MAPGEFLCHTLLLAFYTTSLQLGSDPTRTYILAPHLPTCSFPGLVVYGQPNIWPVGKAFPELCMTSMSFGLMSAAAKFKATVCPAPNTKRQALGTGTSPPRWPSLLNADDDTTSRHDPVMRLPASTDLPRATFPQAEVTSPTQTRMYARIRVASEQY